MNSVFSMASSAGSNNGCIGWVNWPYAGVSMPSVPKFLASALAVLAMLPPIARAADTTPAAQLERFASEAGARAQADRGLVFFTTRHAVEWSCASCHGKPPVNTGKHASTGKSIDALAPAFNARAFTSTARVDKWFRRNCNDVLKRECSAAEKADVLAYLLQLQP